MIRSGEPDAGVASDVAGIFAKALVAALGHYTSAPPTVVTVGSGEFPRPVLSPPADWPVQDHDSWETLPNRLNRLLPAAPVLVLPSFGDLCDSSRNAQDSDANSTAVQFEAAVAAIEAPEAPALLAMLLPTMYLTSKAKTHFRCVLARQWQPNFVLYSTGALPAVHRGEQAAVVVLHPTTSESVKRCFFQVPRRGDSESVKEDLERLLQLPKGRSIYGYVMEGIASPEEGWPYAIEEAPSPDNLSVASLFNIERGYVGRPRDLCEAHTRNAFRLLRGRDIQEDGTLAEPDPDSDLWYSDIPERHRLQAGDVLMRSDFLPGRAGAALVRDEDLPAAAGSNTIALRPISSVTPEHMRLILALLRSSAVEEHTPGHGAAGLIHLRKQDLESLPLPRPDEALATALSDLDTAGRQLGGWSAEAAVVARAIFTDVRDTGQARQHIIEAGQILRLRAETAAQLDDFGHIVRTRFPYPIALRWRETEARKSAGDLGPAYDAVLDATEILLCYSALLAAAVARAASIELSSVTALREKLTRNQGGGPGLGEWTAVLEEIAGKKKRRGLGADHPLHELGTAFTDDQISAARQRHSARRNNQAHLRRADSVELPQALKESFGDLTLLLNHTRFLADWPLIQITGVTWDAFRGQATVGFRRLMGDHPVVPTETMMQPSSALETDSLYVIDRSHQLHLLRPFLTCRICPTCRSWSTFHVDKVNHELVLKSLEHGHYFTDPTTTEPLHHVGLL
ncbi:hypothetical protein ABT120_20020 [Nonomuraea angiospora]|uniref:hypothetical protein n=1 Tax=Nonomuraea angiospora TaxID=46172 RepID=UPI00332DAB15